MAATMAGAISTEVTEVTKATKATKELESVPLIGQTGCYVQLWLAAFCGFSSGDASRYSSEMQEVFLKCWKISMWWAAAGFATIRVWD